MHRPAQRASRRFVAALPLWISTVLGSACTGPMAAHAEGEAHAMNRVHFRVECSRKVSNDRITAIVGVTDEASDAAQLANRVNQAMQWALERARSFETVESQSGSYQTHPIQQDGQIRRWRASQDLVLSSNDVEAVTTLVGVLQSRLLVRSVHFGVSPTRRREVHDELITECLGAYQKRADSIRKALTANDYALVDLSIDAPTGGVPRSRAYAERDVYTAVAEPALEAGESEIAIGIHATIELER